MTDSGELPPEETHVNRAEEAEMREVEEVDEEAVAEADDDPEVIVHAIGEDVIDHEAVADESTGG